jgi:hypothetical protein
MENIVKKPLHFQSYALAVTIAMRKLTTNKKDAHITLIAQEDLARPLHVTED